MQLLDDVKKAYGIAEDQQVAVLLGKGKSTISKWRASGEIPARAEKQLRKLLSEREAGAAPLVLLPPHGTLNKVCAVFLSGPDAEAGQLVVEIFD